MKAETVQFITYLSVFSFVAPAIFYFSRRKWNPRQNHIIGIFMMVCGLFDLLLTTRYIPETILCNIQDVLQFSILTWFFYELIYKKRTELFMLVSVGVYIAILLASVFYLGIFSNYNLLWATGSFILTTHSFVYIFSVHEMVVDRYFDRNFFSNLILTGTLLFYFSMTIVIFLLAGQVFKTEDAASIRAFWSLHNIFNILKNIGLAIGFYYTGRRQVYMTMEQLERIARKLEEEVPVDEPIVTPKQ